MEIIIGRDSDSSCLAFLIDGKYRQISSQILPNTVSRLKKEEKTGHCRLSIKGNIMCVSNLNPQNATYVDGEEIVFSKIIDSYSIVELGADQYRISIKKLLKQIGYVPPVSITHLNRVWERYDSSLLRLQIEQQKAVNRQKLQGLISQASVLCVVIPSVIPSIPIPGFLRILFITGSLTLGVCFYIKGTRIDNSFVVKKRELDEWFKNTYVCPKCGFFFGFIPYDNLLYKKNCPNPDCKTPFITK